MTGAGYNSKIGRLGEDLASRFLAGQGYKVVDRNFRTRFGEIDLIAQREDLSMSTNNEILFCEVKTRSSQQYGYPEQAVDANKIKHLLATAKLYLKIKNISGFWRVDIISVELNNLGEAKIEWFKDVTGNY